MLSTEKSDLVLASCDALWGIKLDMLNSDNEGVREIQEHARCK